MSSSPSRLLEKATRDPSGDQVGSVSQKAFDVSWRKPLPSGAIVKISASPSLSLTKATLLAGAAALTNGTWTASNATKQAAATAIARTRARSSPDISRGSALIGNRIGRKRGQLKLPSRL